MGESSSLETGADREGISLRGGWLHGVRHAPSANCDRRPAGSQIELIVVHGISLPPGRFGGDQVERLFCNRLDADLAWARPLAALRVAAHAWVRRSGEVVQFCDFEHRAWHAGASWFAGRGACNDFSIGIELEGADDVPYAPAQYRRLGQLCALLMARYPKISRERIVGHSDIAAGRKSDPGPAFRWSWLHRELRRAQRG